MSYVHAASAVLSGELNPENMLTSYEFQYAPAAGCATLENQCPGTLQTAGEESSEYGRIATTLEATGLQPSTAYRYRLLAVNRAGEAALGETGGAQLPEGVFTTATGPAPQASTGPANVTGPTTTTLTGSIDPDGLPATYSFELGVYAGANTQYGVVFSGPAGEGATPIVQTLPVGGLQPGTTYAYRIAISSGYIENPANTLLGAPLTFTTPGLPAVLSSENPLTMLAVPGIAFPKETTAPTARTLTNAQKLASALRTCRKDRKRKRVACEKQAHKKYGPKPKKK